MSRTGKIARLPRLIRDQLNRRLSDGEVGSRLVAWLNTLPEVQAVLEQDFHRRPITEQNLSEWRQGGYQDWLRHEDARAWAAQLAEQSDDLEKDSGAIPLCERAAYPALVAICGLLRSARTSTDPVEQRRTIISAAQQLTNLRRASYQAEKLRFERQRDAAKQQPDRERHTHHAAMRRTEQKRRERSPAEARRDAEMRATIISVDQTAFTKTPSVNPLPSNQIQPHRTKKTLAAAAKPRSFRRRPLKGFAPSKPTSKNPRSSLRHPAKPTRSPRRRTRTTAPAHQFLHPSHSRSNERSRT